jgi:hypothetical protein
MCAPASGGAGSRVSAPTPEALAKGELTVNYAASGTLTSAGGVADPNGPATDPLAHVAPLPGLSSPCVVSPGPALGGYTGISEPLSAPATMVGLGHVDLSSTLVGLTGQLDARLWDVSPDGSALLVSRGTYRLDTAGFDSPSGTLRVPLFGNHWPVPAGHRLRLDLTQVDQPFLRPSTLPSSLSFADPRLSLPIREAVEQTLSGH